MITVVHLVAGLGMLVVVPLGLGLTAVPGSGTVRRYWWYATANATGFGLCGVLAWQRLRATPLSPSGTV